MKAEEIKQKAKPKKALFLINNNEVNTLHYVERILDVSMTISAEGISFNDTEDDVYFVLTEIETNPRIAERLKSGFRENSCPTELLKENKYFLKFSPDLCKI